MVVLASLGILLGLWLLWSALANWDWYKGITDFAADEALFGEDATRWRCGGVVGVVAIGYGIAVIAQAR